jgi:transcriptional regulator GlxA family with amidase domain
MKIAIVTLEAFNEIDSFLASAILNRVTLPGWEVQICCPAASVTSMNGVQILGQQPLDYANTADVVLFGSGMKTLDYANDPAFLARFSLDPARQLIGAQCSGALILHRLGLTQGIVASDTMTAPLLEEEGLTLSENPLYSWGNIATAGGCLASHYLAAWVIARMADWQTSEDIIHYVAPVGQKQEYVDRAKATILPTLQAVA